MTVTWTLALDALMAVLLAISIATTIVLNRRLNILRGDRAELEKLTQDFREATDRADHGVVGLKVSAQSLQERIESARTLADDLEFLIERGGGIADRLEAEVRREAAGDARQAARSGEQRCPRETARESSSATLRGGTPPARGSAPTRVKGFG
jgi:biopolymer transport protein ExbB/TolQ